MNDQDGGLAYPCTWWERDPAGGLAACACIPGMNMRQAYKIAALGLLDADYKTERDIAIACGKLADEMLAEDEAHERGTWDGL